MTNSTISGNTTSTSGGGIHVDSGTATVTNSTISGNTANGTGNGGGITNVGTLILTPVVHGEDVGVAQRRRGPGLGPEAAQERGVVGQRRVQDLDRHPAAEARVVGQEDVRRRAGANHRREPVAAAENATDVVRDTHGSHGVEGTLPNRR